MSISKKIPMRGMKGIPKATLRGAVKPAVKGGVPKLAASVMRKK